LTAAEIFSCRACGSKRLNQVLDLGSQVLTGVFPTSPAELVTEGPLRLKWCESCELLQLGDDFDPAEMYGENYGYESSLNNSMIAHLKAKVEKIERQSPLEPGDVVIDIGSNDATLLRSYASKEVVRVGIDPIGIKFQDKYVDGVTLIPDFFSSEKYFSHFGKKARVITSIAMFYDLPDPLSFVRSISEALGDEGVWHFEQSYLPSMLRMNSYDTVCHEHVEYYSLKVVQGMLARWGLRVIDVELNSVNGGSFAVTAAKQGSHHSPNHVVINWLLEEEKKLELDTPQPYLDFAERTEHLRESLVSLVRGLNAEGFTVAGYGASTKGNVTLQYCGFGPSDLKFLAEVNSYKFGRYSPGSHIPIVSEEESRSQKPDYLLMLPWHFRDGLIRKEKDYLMRGGKFIIPFPYVEIVA